MHITATEAKNKFGSICSAAKIAPVFVEKAGQVDTVILSADQYRTLQANQKRYPWCRSTSLVVRYGAI